MPRRVLDTNILINHWVAMSRRKRRSTTTTTDARRWARELIKLQQCNAILTPVYIEFVCGQTNERDLGLARAFLHEFDIADEGRVIPEDWADARRIAQRVTRGGGKRQLGDCIIRAICNRLHLEVLTAERRFPG